MLITLRVVLADPVPMYHSLGLVHFGGGGGERFRAFRRLKGVGSLYFPGGCLCGGGGGGHVHDALCAPDAQGEPPLRRGETVGNTVSTYAICGYPRGFDCSGDQAAVWRLRVTHVACATPSGVGTKDGRSRLDCVGSPSSFVWMHACCGERLPLGQTCSLGYGLVGPVLQACRRIRPHGG